MPAGIGGANFNRGPANGDDSHANSRVGAAAAGIRRVAALPDQVADYLRDMILSSKWPPGHRIVETRVARELGVGQPTVREALGKLEEAGLVVRAQNRGCSVTQLTEEEYIQIFRVRAAMECLVAELLIENRSHQQAVELKAALRVLKVAAGRSVEDYYRADIELHRTMWRLSGNKFLERALSQLVTPLFAFAMIKIIAHPGFDLALNASRHDELIRAILLADKAHARNKAEQILKWFREEGLSIITQGATTTEGQRSRRSSRFKSMD